ncbi:hypothetical protein [Flavobacterium sp.]
MKNSFIALLLVVSVATFAQGKRGMNKDKENLSAAENVELQVKKLTSELTLNEKQRKEVRALVEREVTKRDLKRSEMIALREKKKEESKAIAEKRKGEMEQEQAKVSEEMKKILTAEQYTKWEKMKEKRKENRLENKKEKMTNKKDKKQNKI